MVTGDLMRLFPAVICVAKAALYATNAAPLVVVALTGVGLSGFRRRKRKRSQAEEPI